MACTEAPEKKYAFFKLDMPLRHGLRQDITAHVIIDIIFQE